MGRAEILIEMDSKVAKALSEALYPDDASPPPGFKLASEVVNDSFKYVIEFKESRHSILTLLSVMDEVSRFAEVIDNTIRLLNEAYKPRHTS